jgi:Mg2+/Co2+ transporter CorC
MPTLTTKHDAKVTSLQTIEEQLGKIVKDINDYDAYEEFSNEMADDVIATLKATQSIANITALVNEINQKRGLLVKKLFF